MILFYDKTTGDITGTINGRVHRDAELGMWMGDRETTGRIVCQWEQGEDKDWRPSIQPEIFTQLEATAWEHKKYKVDVQTGAVVKRSDEEILERQKARKTVSQVREEHPVIKRIKALEDRVQGLEDAIKN